MSHGVYPVKWIQSTRWQYVDRRRERELAMTRGKKEKRERYRARGEGGESEEDLALAGYREIDVRARETHAG